MFLKVTRNNHNYLRICDNFLPQFAIIGLHRLWVINKTTVTCYQIIKANINFFYLIIFSWSE